MIQVIPVIDIKAGKAVLAQQGNRQHYQPLNTPLCTSSNPKAVIDAYLTLWPFNTIYIADLDQLMATGSNHSCINTLFKTYPELNFMIDSGGINPHYQPCSATQYQPVLGTESINACDLTQIRQNFILSLDFCSQNQPMGEQQLYDSPALWPKELIIMTLALVGKNQGADLQKIAHYCQTYPQHHFIAAGGVRGRQDLNELHALGVKKVLIASALHSGQLTDKDLQHIHAQ